ncbi:PREDICTED: uncharacterized protein LOC109342286 [Lupinus angustifolius]|uniref:uncharacterized protein LOC109342286 n=1 Tax=Lupinus angustifolius TaxID=3871 RepID=UPI00092E8A89|nr:PREDICTED: uncharacterized protein LOC109342286 [Lupinus angustifolius]
MPPVPGRPLIQYLIVLDESMGCVLGQHDDSGRKEQAIYYLSKKFTACEIKYSLLERTCCALVLLSEYDIAYVTQKAIKGSVIADYLVNRPLNKLRHLGYEFPDADIMVLSDESREKENWTQVFDGASNAFGHGVGVVLVSPIWKFLPFTARLCFDCTKNMTEYEACILGLKADIDSKAKVLEVFGDSTLVIHQIKGEWETRDSKLVPYRDYILELIQFDQVDFYHIPREDNRLADALATLSSMFHVGGDSLLLFQIRDNIGPAYCNVVEEEPDGKLWYHDIREYLRNQAYPSNDSENDKRTLRRLATYFFLSGDVIYKRNHDMVFLRCLEAKEAQKMVEEMHEGTFGTHANEHAMAKKIMRADSPEDGCDLQGLARNATFALHGYRTSVHTSTGATPYSLVYGMEVVLPLEVEIPSLRLLAEAGLKESE